MIGDRRPVAPKCSKNHIVLRHQFVFYPTHDVRILLSPYRHSWWPFQRRFHLVSETYYAPLEPSTHPFLSTPNRISFRTSLQPKMQPYCFPSRSSGFRTEPCYNIGEGGSVIFVYQGNRFVMVLTGIASGMLPQCQHIGISEMISTYLNCPRARSHDRGSATRGVHSIFPLPLQSVQIPPFFMPSPLQASHSIVLSELTAAGSK